jgi:hypothetical protein
VPELTTAQRREQVRELTDKVQRARQEEARAQAVVEAAERQVAQVLERVQSQFGVDSLESARELLAQLRSQVDERVVQAQEALRGH